MILNGRTTYLGRLGLEETTRNYHRVIAEWIANGRQLRIDPHQITGPSGYQVLADVNPELLAASGVEPVAEGA